ncbi:MAG: hypothetical protein IJ392_02875 [Clostridia bacterium]|nr:hypothetical protein [Clostridia bacterium]
MRSILRRALCALLCLCMLPCAALAEGDVSGVRFDVAFTMDPQAFSPEQRPLATGLADLMNILTLKGSLDQAYTGCFDLNTEWMLNGEDATRTTLRLFGTEAFWGVESSLLGDEMLMVNMISLLEFSMKMYFHLEIPLQRLTLLISPYVHTSAFEALGSAWQGVMLAQEGDRTIPYDQLLALASQLAEIAEGDRAFYYWTQSVGMEAGYDETLMEVMLSLPEWAETILDEEGITVTTRGATETWRTGETTLFTRTVEDSVTAWSITLPAFPNGYAFSAFYNGQPDGEHILQVRIDDDYGDTTLDSTIKANNIPDLTREVPIASPFSLEVEMTGDFMEEKLHLLFEGEGEGNNFSLRMLNAATRQPQLTMFGTLEATTPSTVPEFTTAQLMEGMNLLSMNDVTLTELLGNVAQPMFDGLVPILVHMPASTVQSLLDLLTEHGVIDLLVNGGAAEYDEYDEEYSEDEYYEEEYYEEEYEEEYYD